MLRKILASKNNFTDYSESFSKDYFYCVPVHLLGSRILNGAKNAVSGTWFIKHEF